MRLKLVLTAILLTAGTPLLAQVAPATNGGGGVPITIGAGFSDFHPDWSGRLGERQFGLTGISTLARHS